MRIARIRLGLLVIALSVHIGWCDSPSEPELKTAHSVAVKYYLSLPSGWNSNSTWPIVVTIDGSGHDFLGNCRGFVRARGQGSFILVTPCVSSNGNDVADEPAVLSIVREVQQEYKGRARFFITGFSAGGHLTWQLIFHHPELLAAAAPAAGNFRFRHVDDISKAEARVRLPIHGFQGEKDKAALNQQWNDAEKLARDNGYKNLTDTVVPGAGHQPFARQVMEFFSSLSAE